MQKEEIDPKIGLAKHGLNVKNVDKTEILIFGFVKARALRRRREGERREEEKEKEEKKRKKEEGRKEEEKRRKTKVWNFVWKLILVGMETLVRTLVWKFCWKILV